MKEYIVYFGIFLLVVGCQQVNKKNANLSQDDFSESSIQEENQILENIYHRFPSPEEMLNRLSTKSFSLDESILANPSVYDSYFDSRSQALNLGVYMSDLACLTVFEKHRASFSYFQALLALSDKLQISSAFDLVLMRRIQNNITNSDSLHVLADLSFESLNNYLEVNHQERIFAIMSLGGFVESLYITFEFCVDYSTENDIVQHIADQKYVLENIIAYSEQFLPDENIRQSIDLIDPLRAIYDEFVIDSDQTRISRDAEGTLILEGGEKLTITENQYNRLLETTINIRQSIIQNKL